MVDRLLAVRLAEQERAQQAAAEQPAGRPLTDADLDALPVYGARPDPWDEVPKELRAL